MLSPQLRWKLDVLPSVSGSETMKQDIAMRWIDDLRRPGLHQISGALNDGVGYSCLGRLCAVMGESFERRGAIYVAASAAESKLLPATVVKQAGLFNSSGGRCDGAPIRIAGRFFLDLADANDSGCSFESIAGAIKQRWKWL
jgi:hypothetical protein